MQDSQHDNTAPRVALIGFGEAGETFARAGEWQGHAAGWDVLAARRAIMPDCGVDAATSAADALAGAQIVLSLVTADAALHAAREYAPSLPKDTIWCDMNSVAPGTKRAAAQAIENFGASYVDVAVMAPVDKQLAVPLLISGPEAAPAQDLLRRLGFAETRIVGEEIGRASAIKMIRSVMVKGIEALTYECAAAAEKAGVFEEVMASLDASERDWNWTRRVAYNRERMETHGVRRAAEMEEVCRTLSELGVDPVMSRGTVIRQRGAAKKNIGERIEA
jgi:3-hydroxyisobutyrate dehydrogenase-like beta-hydroxyacid dehydrogenase